MRRQAVRIVAVALGAAAVGVVGVLIAQSALASLGVGDAAGKQIVDGWLDSGYLSLSPASIAFKAAEPASRAALVKNAIAWARTYTESPAFRAAYEKERQASRPSPPEVDGTVDDELARQRAERRKGIEDMKKNLAQTTPEMRKAMESAIKEAEAANQKMEADPKMVAMFRQMVEVQRAEDQEAYKGRTGGVREALARRSEDPRRPPAAGVPRRQQGRRLRRQAGACRKAAEVRGSAIRREAAHLEAVLSRWPRGRRGGP